MRHTSAIIALCTLASACWIFGVDPGATPPLGAHAGTGLAALMTFAVAVSIEPKR